MLTRRAATTVRTVVLVLVVLLALAYILAVRPPEAELTGGQVLIRIWQPWGGPQMETFRDSVAIFERSHPDIVCRTLYVPNDTANSQKFYTAVIGNAAPEVMFVDGPQVAEWAERGLLMPLDELLIERGIDPNAMAEEFFAPCWRQCVYRGKIYAITFCADANFALFWNREVFRQAVEAGDIPPGAIDPNQPPRTLAELDRWSELITKTDQDGNLVRVGLVPWDVYGAANSLFTWGWAFGGRFYDARTQTVTCAEPRVVAALEWMCSYAQMYDPQRIQSFRQSLQSEERSPFILGQQALALYHMSGLDDIVRFRPDLEFGTAPLPEARGGEYGSTWIGGWTLAIPAGQTEPARVQAALDYILWACATQEGTSLEVRSQRNFPGWEPSGFFEEVADDPHLATYVRMLRSSQHQRPVMPAQAFYTDQLAQAVNDAIYGYASPAEALQRAQERTQRELDRILAQREGRP